MARVANRRRPKIARGNTEGLSYLRCGDEGSMPIVLLHGIASNACSFEPLMMALHPHYPSVAWDAPGHGRTEPFPEPPRLAHYAGALSYLINYLEIKRFVLVGHAFGCLVAARYTRVTPAGVAALFFIAPALGYGEKKDAPLPPQVAARIAELGRLGPAEFAAKRAPALLADPCARPDVLLAVERVMAGVRRPGYDHAAQVLANGRLESDAAKIEVPAAVIMGSEDHILEPASGHFAYLALQTSAPRTAFHYVYNAGHALCQEQPQEVAQRIIDFVEGRTDANA
jgi:pimeloyl-ACP methyl ester carboxylesterase